MLHFCLYHISSQIFIFSNKYSLTKWNISYHFCKRNWIWNCKILLKKLDLELQNADTFGMVKLCNCEPSRSGRMVYSVVLQQARSRVQAPTKVCEYMICKYVGQKGSGLTQVTKQANNESTLALKPGKGSRHQ